MAKGGFTPVTQPVKLIVVLEACIGNGLPNPSVTWAKAPVSPAAPIFNTPPYEEHIVDPVKLLICYKYDFSCFCYTFCPVGPGGGPGTYSDKVKELTHSKSGLVH